MAKSYYEFVPRGKTGEIATPNGNLIWHDEQLYTAGNESVLIWNLKTKEIIKKLDGESLVEKIEVSNIYIAVGYRSGIVKVWNFEYEETHVLEGHSSGISSMVFSDDGLTLYTGSADTGIIIWDLVSESPKIKLEGHKDMVTALLLDQEKLISGGKDRFIKIWDTKTWTCIETLLSSTDIWGLASIDNHLLVVGRDNYIHIWEENHEISSITRKNLKGRTIFIEVKNQFIILASANTIEVWKKKTQKELEKMARRRRKRAEKKDPNSEPELLESDHYEIFTVLKTKSKIHSGCFISDTEIILSYNDNSIEAFSISQQLTKNFKLHSINSPIRSVCLSSQNDIISSGCSQFLHIWDVNSMQLLNTFKSEYITCSCFLPGDRLVAAGCKSGFLQVFDILSAEISQYTQIHEGEVWGIDVNPKRKQLLTGSADHTLKIWVLKPKWKLSEVISMKDEVLACKFSPCYKFIIAALIDFTIQVLYSDSKKNFLVLYGHKLPATCFSVSSDSVLLASGSTDKNLKIWGLNFGDCHKSIIAHTQGLTDILFVKETHLLFTASRDKTIKYWDCDRYECIQVIKGHMAEIWSLSLSSEGDFLVSAASDFSIRIWTQSENQLFLEEEKELLIENEITPKDLGVKETEAEAVPVVENSEKSVTSAEKVMEAIEVIEKYRENTDILPPEFLNGDPESYLMRILQRQTHIESALYVIPYWYAEKLILELERILETTNEVEFVAKTILNLIKIHETRIKFNTYIDEDWLNHLNQIKYRLYNRIVEVKDTYGKNLAATSIILNRLKFNN